jgi:hypothetical protein
LLELIGYFSSNRAMRGASGIVSELKDRGYQSRSSHGCECLNFSVVLGILTWVDVTRKQLCQIPNAGVSDCWAGLPLNEINFNVPPLSLVHNKGKAIPLQALTDPEGSRRLRLPDFKTVGT